MSSNGDKIIRLKDILPIKEVLTDKSLGKNIIYKTDINTPPTAVGLSDPLGNFFEKVILPRLAAVH